MISELWDDIRGLTFLQLESQEDERRGNCGRECVLKNFQIW